MDEENPVKEVLETMKDLTQSTRNTQYQTTKFNLACELTKVSLQTNTMPKKVVKNFFEMLSLLADK